jgi:hypothetical protein
MTGSPWPKARFTSWFFSERLIENVSFEGLDQLGDSLGVGPGFGAVVAGSEAVGGVGLVDKAVVGLDKFLDGGPVVVFS